MEEEYMLDVKGLRTTFSTESGRLTAVDDVTFKVKPGETLGIVGESGCGKSVTAQSIMRLLNEDITTYEGEITYKGQELLSLPKENAFYVW